MGSPSPYHEDVTARTQHSARPPQRRWRALLVLGLLVGLLGMHALGPGGASATPAHHGHPQQMGVSAMPVGTEFACHGDGAGHGGGHAQHADPTCASGAVGTGHVLPAPLPDPVGQATVPEPHGSYVTTSSDGGRAPPSLAELQLLRI